MFGWWLDFLVLSVILNGMKNNKKQIQMAILGLVVVLVVVFGLWKVMGSNKFSPAKGLTVEIIKAAPMGKEAKKGQLAKLHYTGWLTDKTKFDSSRDRNQPFEFRVGQRQVIRGWDLGVEGMHVGEKRMLTIESELGYGPAGAGNVIPPNATLVFEVELLDVND